MDLQTGLRKDKSMNKKVEVALIIVVLWGMSFTWTYFFLTGLAA